MAFIAARPAGRWRLFAAIAAYAGAVGGVSGVAVRLFGVSVGGRVAGLEKLARKVSRTGYVIVVLVVVLILSVIFSLTNTPVFYFSGQLLGVESVRVDVFGEGVVPADTLVLAVLDFVAVSTPSMCSACNCRSTVLRGLSMPSPHFLRGAVRVLRDRSSMMASRSGGIESRAQRMASRNAVGAVHADGHRAADHLGELLGEAGRHLGCVRVDHVAAVVVFDAGAGQGHQIGCRDR